MPYLESGDFLGIFIVATLVLLFGVGFASIITLYKMKFLSSKWQIVGYAFWLAQVYTLYDLSQRIHSNPFTLKVLAIAMIAYLFVPHLYFYLISESDKRYDSQSISKNQFKE